MSDDGRGGDAEASRGRSCEVVVQSVVRAVALEVLALDERLDPLLDELRARHEARRELARDLGDQLVVAQHLARLHDAHDRGLDEVVARAHMTVVTP